MQVELFVMRVAGRIAQGLDVAHVPRHRPKLCRIDRETQRISVVCPERHGEGHKQVPL